MPATAAALPIAVADYLEGEGIGEIRHEYVAGQVFAMAGASEAHNRIAGNLFFHLRAAARGTPCGVFISDMKARVEAHDAFYYPDVLLTCDPADNAPLYKRAPCLIAEVLSASTELIDRREKLIAYRTLPTLRYYLLIAQERRLVELYARDADGGWRHRLLDGTDATGQEALAFDCPPLHPRLTLDDIYEDVVFEDGVPAPNEARAS